MSIFIIVAALFIISSHAGYEHARDAKFLLTAARQMPDFEFF